MRSRYRWTACRAIMLLSVVDAAGAQVDVELDTFGVGGAYRANDPTGIRVILTSTANTPTQVWVQWEMPNAEGDVAELARTITLSPGAPTPLWLYGTLPPDARSDSIWSIRIFQDRDGRPGRELGGSRISPRIAGAVSIDPAFGMIGVVGRNQMNLTDYRNPSNQAWSRAAHPPGLHEVKLPIGMSPRDLPDRWEGLRSYQAIVWSDGAVQDLRDDAGEALREYVRRGGHLVIALPAAGNPWGLGTVGKTMFDDLLPTRAPMVVEEIDLTDIMSILAKTDTPLRDVKMSLRCFGDDFFEGIDNEYEPLLATPEGRVVVIQRIVGFGRITLIGIDLSMQLASMGLPEADVFWNRVLGIRGDTPRSFDLTEMAAHDPVLLTRRSGEQLPIGDGRVVQEDLDKPGQTEMGVFLGFILFLIYLLVAGPLGFYLLKQHNLVQHSWVAFALTAAAFTGISWGGVQLLRGHGIEVHHVTVLDHVATMSNRGNLDEPRLQRAMSWFSLYMPSYGETRMSIESDPGQRDILTTWRAPEKPGEHFPNTDRYFVDIGRTPNDYQVPVRATATQFQAHWQGALDPDWGGMIRMDPDDPIRITLDVNGREQIRGTLVHDLPRKLSDVTTIWVSNNRRRRPRLEIEDQIEVAWAPPPGPSGRTMLNRGSWVRWPTWNQGDPLRLADPEWKSLQSGLHTRYIAGAEDRNGFTNTSNELGRQSQFDYLEMLSLFEHMTPPKYHRVDNKDPKTVVLSRRMFRELDLSAWLNRPCLIVIGFMQEVPTPIPLRVDGKPAPVNTGLVMVRWILPLPVDEDYLTRP